MCLDLFDAVEADGLKIDRPLLNKLAGLINALTAAHRSMAVQYVFSGRATTDMLDSIRTSFEGSG